MAADYDAVRADEAADRGFWLPALREVGRLARGERILDLGAGTGRYSRLLAEFAHVVAFDLSPPMLAHARAKRGFEVARGDAHRLPFRPGAFDASVLVMVLHQFTDFRGVFREVARVSRRAVIATNDMAHRDLGIMAEAFPSLVAIDRARFPSIETIAEGLRDVGFRAITVERRVLQRSVPTAIQIDRIRRRYISTLDLIPREEFDRGVAFIEAELPRRHGGLYDWAAEFTFLGASR